MIKQLTVVVSILGINQAVGAEFSTKGVLDIRASFNDTLTSYADGGYGKFGSNDGASISLAQAGVQFKLDWDSGVSAQLIANSYLNENESSIGVTEAFLSYRSLPNESGYRWKNRSGIFYPKISLENDAIAWASKYTLNSSMLNTWLGEEIRVLGSEFELTRLGKYNDADYDVSWTANAFVNNDPAGSLLSWHGWTSGNQQTLWQESRPLPPFLAHQPGNELAGQAQRTEPFLEIDNRIGYHTSLAIKPKRKGLFRLGYFNNNGTPYIVENGQYSWRTRFVHAEALWRFANHLEVSAQYLIGDTLMQHPHKADAVNNDYQTGYVSISKRWARHRLTTRLEGFSVTDNDSTVGDNNDEHGTAVTLSYNYRLSRGWLLATEYNIVDSYRPSRIYAEQPINLTEQQLQFSARYFFSITP